MLGPRVNRALAVSGFCGFFFLSLASAQETGENPAGRKPLVLKPGPADASEKDSGPITIENLQDLASRLLHHAPDAGCHPDNCRILVTNFVSPDGSAFPNGIQWSDDLSSVFANKEKAIQVVDRTLFKNLLQTEGISAKLQKSEPAARWLGKQFNATVVLVGQARMIKEAIVELSARFLNVNEDNLIGPSSEVNLQLTSSMADFSSLSGLTSPPPYPPPLPPFPDTVNGEKVYQMGAGGVGVGIPNCYYMPSPKMTADARSVGFSGSVVVEGAVGTDGAVRAVRIVKGAPFGLGEELVKAVETWKCKPAFLDGSPVAVVVQFEVNYRSNPAH